MGFFSELIAGAVAVGTSVFGKPQPVAAAPTLLAPPAAGSTEMAVLRAVTEAPATDVLLAKGVTGGPVITPEQARRLFPGGTAGRLRKRTIVQTIDPVTGKVFSQEIFAGGVAVRAADVAAARRVFRQIRKLDSKLPRKTVKQSKTKQLTDRVVQNALERAGDIPDCPK